MRSLPALLGALLIGTSLNASAANLNDIFNADMLGTNLRYFESVAGIARQSFGDEHHFRIQGCNLTAHIGDAGVYAMRLELTPNCHADLSSFIGDYAPAPNTPLTFGALANSTGADLRFTADCLTMCGNASDPTVSALWEGPRAVSFIQVKLEAALTDGPALEASDQWQAHMTQAKGEDWVIDTQFNCNTQFDPQANHAFKNVKVNAVTVGHELTIDGCY